MKKSIKALLLCAGLGTRLRPITYDLPKCLVEIAGRPILEHWFKKLEEINCDSAIVNTHYLHEQVSSFINKYQSNNLTIKVAHEKFLLGTFGTLRQHIDQFRGTTNLLIHADNAMEDDLNELIKAHKHRPKGCLITMLTFETTSPEKCGIVVTDHNGIVIEFHEKKINSPGNIANGAVYVFDDEFITYLDKFKPEALDFSLDILPNLIGRIFTCHTRAHYFDIGTPQTLREAQKIWESL